MYDNRTELLSSHYKHYLKVMDNIEGSKFIKKNCCIYLVSIEWISAPEKYLTKNNFKKL